jgi:hypothetical protein
VNHCYKLSPFQAHWGRWHYTHLLWLVCLFTAHVGSVPSSLSSGAFLTPPLLQAFPLQGCWAVATTPAFSGQLFYLQFHEGLPLPPLQCSGCPTLFTTSFVVVVVVYSVWFFSLFSLGGGQFVQGAMLIWPRVVCGSTTCHLAHLVVCVS